MVIIGTTADENVDKTIENTFGEVCKKAAIRSHPKLLTKLHDCKHKLYAVRYHLRTIRDEIKRSSSNFQKTYNAQSGVSYEQHNPILIYETESLLFQIKSNLDSIVQTLGFIVPVLKSSHTFGHSGNLGQPDYRAGGKIIKMLKQSSEKELSDVFERNRKEWIQEMVVWRDTITHYAKLKNFSCFVEEPYRGGNVIIHYPSMPNGEELDNYCKKIYENLIELYKDVFKEINKRE